MTRDAKQLGSAVALATERGEPVSSTTQDGRCHSHCLDVGNSGGATVYTAWVMMT